MAFKLLLKTAQFKLIKKAIKKEAEESYWYTKIHLLEKKEI